MTAIAPRQTRLIRAADLPAFRAALLELATAGTPLDARGRIVVVPTRAAAEQVRRGIERASARGTAVLLPDFVTAGQLVEHLSSRQGGAPPPLLNAAEREALMGAACRWADAAGHAPPFRLRPGLIAEILRFYDELQRRQKDVGIFERLALAALEPGAELDRGAARLVQQTRFIVAAFREFERRSREAGADEHQERARLRKVAGPGGCRHVVVAVGDEAFDRYGLCSADWDLLARLPGLLRLDVLTTDAALVGAPHERMHQLLPGIEEVRVDRPAAPGPELLIPERECLYYVAHDREEEVAAFARWAKTVSRPDYERLSRMALVVQQPLPYVYLARESCRSAHIPCQLFDALPLAAEPYAAAVDLVFAFVTSGFARGPAAALLGSPHFAFGLDDGGERGSAAAALDVLLADAGYLGDLAALEGLIERRHAGKASATDERTLANAERLLRIAGELEPLRTPASVSEQLSRLLVFLRDHEAPQPQEDSGGRRARVAILGLMAMLRDAFAQHDATVTPFEDTTSLVRRWIEGGTFAPRIGESGVHVIDAESARFGEFERVQLAGLVDGEWPAAARRSILYGSDILRQLGWPSEVDRREAARVRFFELLRSASQQVRVSSFSLDGDSLVSPSPFLEDLAACELEGTEHLDEAIAVFEHEGLTLPVPRLDHLGASARAWAEHRLTRERGERAAGGSPATTDTLQAPAYSLSALERYQDCPFRFFAAHVLRLEEEPEDQSVLTPRRRGQLLHDILHRFFARWDDAGEGAITPDTLDRARQMFTAVAEPLLSALPESEAALERARVCGTAISLGVMDIVLGLEATRKEAARERWLEYRLEGRFSLGTAGGPAVPLRGVADRIDLLPGRRLRVIDYKTGFAPGVDRALQVPVYALCAQQRLSERDGAPWRIAEAMYLSFAGRRAEVPVVSADDDAAAAGAALSAARERLLQVLSGIEAGHCAPAPYDPAICRTCAYSAVCRIGVTADD